jgi:hypothetical protein
VRLAFKFQMSDKDYSETETVVVELQANKDSSGLEKQLSNFQAQLMFISNGYCVSK